MSVAELETKFRTQMDMWREESRLASFKKWVFDDKQRCSASALAESGFYYIGTEEEPDAVQCFLCSKSLDGWEPHDDPWDEHIKHAPKCDFAQMRQPEVALSLYQLIGFKTDQYHKLSHKFIEEQEKMELETLNEISINIDNLINSL